MKDIHPVALFRLTVLGPLASRDHLERGELKQVVRELAAKTYDIPNSKRVQISESSIERWYYQWRRGGIDALAPTTRVDKGRSTLPDELQSRILTAKKEQPSRSVNAIKKLLELGGVVGNDKLSRSAVYRVLQANNLSTRSFGNADKIQQRLPFVAKFAGDIWQGDVMHARSIKIGGKQRKLYLVSFMDDASRLIVNSQFRLGEKAQDVEAVLKDALLKRGVPKRIIIDNGAAYRAGSLQGSCARLKIKLAYCRPYQPQGKGKLEKWHATFRRDFINEVDWQNFESLSELNGSLNAYLDELYHQRPHGGLADKMTPLERWRQDVPRLRQLGSDAKILDELFYYRIERKVRNDSSISFANQFYEVSHELIGQKVMLVYDPETKQPQWVESQEGNRLGAVHLVDPIHNSTRRRCSSVHVEEDASPSKPSSDLITEANKIHKAKFQINTLEEK